MKKRLAVLSFLLALCGGCATVQVGLKAAYMVFQVVKFVTGSDDKAEQPQPEETNNGISTD